MIPRKLRLCRTEGSTKGCEDRLHLLPQVSHAKAFRALNNRILLLGKGLLLTAQTLRKDDGDQPFDRFFELIVNQDVIVLIVLRDLAPGSLEPALDLVFRILTTIPKPPLQRLAIRRQHKDADRIGQVFFDLRCTLNVNVEQEILATLSRV